MPSQCNNFNKYLEIFYYIPRQSQMLEPQNLTIFMKVAWLCPTLCDSVGYTVHGILQARILEWVAVPFSRRSSNPGIEPRCPTLQILYQLSHQGSPRILEWVAYPISSGPSRPRNQTRVSCIAGGFFTS